MYRRSRQTDADELSITLSKSIHPLHVIACASVAMSHLGVPILLGVVAPNRASAYEIMETYPNAQQKLEEINVGYRRLDRSCMVFDYPCDGRTEGYMQLYLLPHYFAHVFPDSQDPSFQVEGTALTQHFQTYGNLHYPLESVLVESLVKAAIDEESQAVGWYSVNFGRIYEAKHGPIDRRISKCPRSGREMCADMRVNPL
ncbi:hypothetical protein BDQ94DRAFT_157747 [Aspergillus welwitschiae]|uniref:Uncharacterized protein n=1 Tax=Aspergillus welwitschiae TaxID=1341132 RepID=A0A3F3QAH2_9EURO|nr:hypothetical protein BDQ94DRAFT_157747 [Aspergillus welwitschiae]RDH36211.1 hypothetical protein BDQ94DRAFT_157747 [Aspergillus welwitschiae]